ncbi:unnamed protein product [Clonostachys byssicola]|uniref:Uncharacterized protein n=1 Tax=Clonostachys byssicola TaxID=160290 RepID=A0A9N9UI50_9HYPO|nr:unnamed protein product [Clonostachys byssicola]
MAYANPRAAHQFVSDVSNVLHLKIRGRGNDPEETADTNTVCVTTDTVTVSVTVNAPVELAITAEPMLV